MKLEIGIYEITVRENNLTHETKRQGSAIFFLDYICRVDKADNSSMVEQKTSCENLNVTVHLSHATCITTYYVTISLHIILLTCCVCSMITAEPCSINFLCKLPRLAANTK